MINEVAQQTASLRALLFFPQASHLKLALFTASLSQFVAGVWTILAASTFWTNYRNWQGAGGHGATWPLMAFLLVLQVRK